MRDIIFRGKRKDTHEWVMGGYCEEADSGRTHIAFWNSFGLGFLDFKEVYPKSVGQYTGLKDKNGKMIFEGDVLAWIDRTVLVTWLAGNAQFDCNFIKHINDKVVVNFKGLPPREWCRCEVIGNIHDNPELIGNI